MNNKRLGLELLLFHVERSQLWRFRHGHLGGGLEKDPEELEEEAVKEMCGPPCSSCCPHDPDLEQVADDEQWMDFMHSAQRCYTPQAVKLYVYGKMLQFRTVILTNL